MNDKQENMFGTTVEVITYIFLICLVHVFIFTVTEPEVITIVKSRNLLKPNRIEINNVDTTYFYKIIEK